jgi:hypothetical protein
MTQEFCLATLATGKCSGQVMGVKPHTNHKVLGGKGPVDILFVRVPGGRGDKVLVGE